MADSTDSNGHHWTVDTLRSHVLALIEAKHTLYTAMFSAQEKAVASAMLAAERAVQKAESASDKRFDANNEWRQSSLDKDQLVARTMIPRAEAESMHKALEIRLAMVEKQITEHSARSAGTATGYGSVITGVGVVLTILTIVSIVFSMWRT